MNQLSIIADSVEDAGHVGRQLTGIFEAHVFHRRSFSTVRPNEHTIVDIDLTDNSQLSTLRSWLRQRPTNGKVIFAVEQGVRRQALQAFAIGATDLMPRP